MPASFYWLIGSVWILSAVYSLPIDDSATDYLRNYGYLPKIDPTTRFGEDFLHEDVASDALKALQRMGNIAETGILDDATKQLLRKPRCGNPDFEIISNHITKRRAKRYALGHSKWGKLELTWKFMNRNHPRSKAEYEQIRRLIYEAMSIWEANSNLKLRESSDDKSDILIDFARLEHGDNFDFAGPGGSLAHAFYPGSGLGGDVHLDDDESWDIENGYEGDVSLFYTLLHELGHSLGLAHSSDSDSIMYAWYSSSRTFDRSLKELHEDDRWGIEQLYGLKDGKKSWGPRTQPKTTRIIPTTTSTTPRPRIEQNSVTSTTQDPKPDECNMSYDAIVVIRHELMIFKGIWMWRFREGRLLQGYPVEFHRMWPDLRGYDHIDAVFERPDGKFVFFIGQEVIVIDSTRQAYTHSLEYLGLSSKVDKIDAIFTWGQNNATYMFSGEDYWRVDNDTLMVNKNERFTYPRKIYTIWKNFHKVKIDTAIQLDGIVYFFSGKVFYKFNDQSMTLEVDKPRVSAQKWMGCKYTEEELSSIKQFALVQNERYSETSSTPPTTTTSTSTVSIETSTQTDVTLEFQESDSPRTPSYKIVYPVDTPTTRKIHTTRHLTRNENQKKYGAFMPLSSDIFDFSLAPHTTSPASDPSPSASSRIVFPEDLTRRRLNSI